MTRAWILHSLKTIIVAIMATFGKPYWESEFKADLDCSPRKFLLLLSEDENWTISRFIVFMIIFSAVLDLICWKCRQVAMILMYLEFIWIVFDTVFVLKTATQLSTLVICFRFLVTALLLGTSARQTILAGTFGVLATLIIEHLIVLQE